MKLTATTPSDRSKDASSRINAVVRILERYQSSTASRKRT